MIRELSSYKTSENRFNPKTNLRNASNPKTNQKNKSQNKFSKKQTLNEHLQINIPSYLMDKKISEKNLNKSNEFPNLTIAEKRTPMHSAGNRVRTTTAKDKKYIENLFNSNANEALNLHSFDNERTLDTTNPTKHTLINYNKDKNVSQQNYHYSTNNFNDTSPNGKIENVGCENFNNLSYQNNSNNDLSGSAKIVNVNNSNNFNHNYNNYYDNQSSRKNLNLSLTQKNTAKNLNNRSSEKLNNSIGAAYNRNKNRKDFENSYSKSPSSNTLKRSFDAKASKGNKSTLRSKSAKLGNNNQVSGKSPVLGASKCKFGVELTDGENFKENGKLVDFN